MNGRIEDLLGRLEDLAKQKDVLGLREVVGGKVYPSTPITSLVQESCVFGRDEDKEKLMKPLLSDYGINTVVSVCLIRPKHCHNCSWDGRGSQDYLLSSFIMMT